MQDGARLRKGGALYGSALLVPYMWCGGEFPTRGRLHNWPLPNSMTCRSTQPFNTAPLFYHICAPKPQQTKLQPPQLPPPPARLETLERHTPPGAKVAIPWGAIAGPKPVRNLAPHQPITARSSRKPGKRASQSIAYPHPSANGCSTHDKKPACQTHCHARVAPT
ncbi:hypothetical protein CRENBAI_007364 [Crenichthys baileyi]|uniref:Uncharacterized protein n=1 Tax=Crenichthys baileyi TaxID=28760 RepID=A0AAV9QQ47_9TELE